MIKNPPSKARNARDAGSIPGWEDLLEKEMATHSGILAWRSPWTESLVGYSPWGRKESSTTEHRTSILGRSLTDLLYTGHAISHQKERNVHLC